VDRVPAVRVPRRRRVHGPGSPLPAGRARAVRRARLPGRRAAHRGGRGDPARDGRAPGGPVRVAGTGVGARRARQALRATRPGAVHGEPAGGPERRRGNAQPRPRRAAPAAGHRPRRLADDGLRGRRPQAGRCGVPEGVRRVPRPGRLRPVPGGRTRRPPRRPGAAAHPPRPRPRRPARAERARRGGGQPGRLAGTVRLRAHVVRQPGGVGLREAGDRAEGSGRRRPPPDRPGRGTGRRRGGVRDAPRGRHPRRPRNEGVAPRGPRRGRVGPAGGGRTRRPPARRRPPRRAAQPRPRVAAGVPLPADVLRPVHRRVREPDAARAGRGSGVGRGGGGPVRTDPAGGIT